MNEAPSLTFAYHPKSLFSVLEEIRRELYNPKMLKCRVKCFVHVEAGEPLELIERRF